MAIERTYNVPLRKAFSKAPDYRRTERAVNELRRFIVHHMKCENVKLGIHLNLEMWKQGRKNPPAKIQIKVLKDKHKIKDKEVEYVLAELPDKPFDLPKKDDKKGKDKKAAKAEEKHEHTHTHDHSGHAEEAKVVEKEEIELEKKEQHKDKQVKAPDVKPETKLRQEEHFPRSQKPSHEKTK